MNFEEKTLESKEYFSGQVIRVTHDKVLLPNGQTAMRELVYHKGAVAVIPITVDGKIILIKQYRKAIEGSSYEIPAGKLEVGEKSDPKAAALRELEEEAALTGDLDLVYDFYTAIGFCNEKIKLYVAKNLERVDNPRPQDEDEFLERYQVTLEEAEALIASGDICDAKTIMAIQYWKLQTLK